MSITALAMRRSFTGFAGKLPSSVDLDFDEFLQFDGKHKRNRHYLHLKSVNYPANNFGRFNYFYRTHRISGGH